MTENHEKPNCYSDFFTKNKCTKTCPFFSVWIQKRLLEYLKLAVDIKRRGLPQRGPGAVNYHKRLLALAKLLPKFSLKNFAEQYDLSYGVVRQWNKEEKVEKETRTLMLFFALDYVQELEKRMSSPKLNLENHTYSTTQKAQQSINYHLMEVKHYDDTIQMLIVKLIKQKINEHSEEDPLKWESTLLSLIWSLSDCDIFNPPNNKKARLEFEQQVAIRGHLERVIAGELFDKLEVMIKNEDKENALKVVEFFKNKLKNLSEDRTLIQMRVINKGKKRTRKDLEQLVENAKFTTSKYKDFSKNR